MMTVLCPYCNGNTFEVGIYRGYGIIYCEHCKMDFVITEPVEVKYLN